MSLLSLLHPLRSGIGSCKPVFVLYEPNQIILPLRVCTDAAGACNAVPKANSEIMERPLYGDSRVCPLSKEASDQIVSGQEEMPLDAFGCT